MTISILYSPSTVAKFRENICQQQDHDYHLQVQLIGEFFFRYKSCQINSRRNIIFIIFLSFQNELLGYMIKKMADLNKLMHSLVAKKGHPSKGDSYTNIFLYILKFVQVTLAPCLKCKCIHDVFQSQPNLKWFKANLFHIQTLVIFLWEKYFWTWSILVFQNKWLLKNFPIL